MKLPEFIDAIDNLVREWNTYEHGRCGVPREQLEAIYDKMREHTVHDLAEAVEAHKRAHLTKAKGKA